MNNRFETFTVLMNKISRNIKKIKNQEMSNYHLKSIHTSILYYLYMSGPLTSKQLCERCEEDKATISRAVEYLESNDFITCDTSDTKRYNSLLSISETGKGLAQKISDKINYVFDQIGGNLTDEQRELFYSQLLMISDGLEEIAKGTIE